MTDQDKPFLTIEDFLRSMKESRKESNKELEKIEILQKETAKVQKETAKMQKENAEAQQETSEQMKRTDEKLERMGVILGNMGRNNGAVAEEFFYSSLSKTKKLGNIEYDEIGREWKKDLKNLRDEYDIILINGKEVAIVEVKYKIHHNDVEKMEKKISNFKILFPHYKNYKVRGAFASLGMSKKSEEEILKNGYFALKQVGKHMEVYDPKN